MTKYDEKGERNKLILKLHRAGLSYSQIAKQFGLNKATVGCIVRESQKPAEPTEPKKRTRLTPEVRQEIIDLYVNQHMKMTEIMKRVQASFPTVRKVLEDYIEEKKSNAFHTFWGKWNVPKKSRVRYRNGYRVVYKGDQGHLRTPYRPDGIFR